MILDNLENIDWHDVGTSVLGIFVLIHTVYPDATGASIVEAFKDGTWIGYAIDLAFAHVLIRFKGGRK